MVSVAKNFDAPIKLLFPRALDALGECWLRAAAGLPGHKEQADAESLLCFPLLLMPTTRLAALLLQWTARRSSRCWAWATLSSPASLWPSCCATTRRTTSNAAATSTGGRRRALVLAVRHMFGANLTSVLICHLYLCSAFAGYTTGLLATIVVMNVFKVRGTGGWMAGLAESTGLLLTLAASIA